MGEKDKILSKFNIKDYKNELELVMDKKAYDEEAKSLLLNTCYKMENFYKDYALVKKDCESKIVFLDEFINLIKTKCNKIKIGSPKEFVDKKYEVNYKDGVIKTYPNEIILLYALYELNRIMPKKTEDDYDEVITNEIINFFNSSIIEVINKSNTINSIEIVRDFNGWSWNPQIDLEENIINNVAFQNLLILFGYDFYNDIVNFNCFVELIEKKIRKNVISEEQLDFLRKYIIFAILEYNNKNEKNHKKCLKIKEYLYKNIRKAIINQQKTIDKMKSDNYELIAKIKKLELILKDKMLLKTAYVNQINKTGKNSFTLEMYAKYLEKKKNKMENEIKNNKLRIEDLSNKNFEHKEVTTLLKKIDENTEKVKLDKHILEMQKSFIEAFYQKIENTDSKKELYNLILEFRYYLNLPIKKDKKIYQIKSLVELYDIILKKLIKKAIEHKVIDTGYKDLDFNFIILKYIFETNIIDFEKINIKVDFIGKSKIEVQYYDGNILESKKELDISGIKIEGMKKSKKMKIFKIGG